MQNKKVSIRKNAGGFDEKLIFRKIIYSILSAILLFASSVFAGEKPTVTKEQAQQWMQNQSVQFIENKGQMTDMEGNPIPHVLFSIYAPGIGVFITEKGLTYIFCKNEEENDTSTQPAPKETKDKIIDEGAKVKKWTRIDMHLKEASIGKKNVIKEEPSESHFNYYYGHCPEGVQGVKQYGRITITNVYPGIDWVLYNSNEKGFKYDFVVRPGANPEQIEIVYSSLKPLQFDEKGNLNIKTEIGTLLESKPISFQNEKNVETKFTEVLKKRNNNGGYDSHIIFSVANYDITEKLIIDPQLWWGTVFGGLGTGPRSIVAGNNCIYIVGYAALNTPFPSPNMLGAYFQGVIGDVGLMPPANAYLGLSSSGSNGFWSGDAFIAKFSLSGVYIWGTFYGGNKSDVATSAAVDLNENLIVTGITGSSNFPLQTSIGGYNQPFANNSDAFILKFNSVGARTWATYYGGSTGAVLFGSQPGQEWANAVCTDRANNIYITGHTTSSNLPVLNAIQPVNAGLADCYIAKFNSTNVLQWSTYYGGTGDDEGRSIGVDNTGDIYVVGYTRSTNFPLQNSGGAYWQPVIAAGAPVDGDAFFLKLSSTGTVLWSTYYGGNGYDRANNVIKDANGNMAISGSTKSTNLPLQNLGGAYNQSSNGGSEDIFLLRLNNTMGLNWATYFGGSQNDNTRTWIDFGTNSLAADSCGNIFFAGWTLSPDLPTVNPPGCGFFDNSFNNAVDIWGRRSIGDLFLLRFNANCTLTWSTYYGGASSQIFPGGIVSDINNHLFVTGEFTSGNNPVINPGGGAYYMGTVTGDDNGFVLKFAPTITSAFINPSSCNACNGTATVNVCWDAPFNYVWSNGSSTINTTSLSNTISNLCPGSYWVEVTSNCNQRDTVYFTLTGGAGSFTLTPTQTNASCSVLGSATVTPSGGTPNYTYSWSPSGNTNTTATGLTIGNHTVTVTDVAGCISTQTFTITAGGTPTATISATTINCNGGTATATAIVNGGNPGYTYSWSPGGGTSSTATGLSTGNYTVTVTDNKGCTSTSSAVIISPPPLVGQFTKGTANCTGCGCKEWIMINATGGTIPYTYTWSGGYVNRYKNQLCPGTYSINIRDKNGCSVNVNLTAP